MVLVAFGRHSLLSDYPPLPSTEDRYKPGYTVDGTYLLKEVLGRGGMGAVFRAEHLILKKEFALKLLAANQISETNWKRFTLEARAIAKMDHPSIVKIHNMGVDQSGAPYYAMDLLTGVTLCELCKPDFKSTLNEILEIFAKIADGLQYAHSKGFIHRDIKPSNIVILTNKNTVDVKIVDFGIAKLLGENESGGQSLTKTGEIFGSPLYMSPEQCLSAACDQRSDIYSLGCTFFEVLAKQPPFRGKTAMETMMMHQSAAVPSLIQTLSEHPTNLAASETQLASLDAILCKMLAKEPDRRYQAVGDLTHDLERVAAGKSVLLTAARNAQTQDTDSQEWTGQPVRASQKERQILIAAFVFIVLLGATVAALAFFGNSKPTKTASPAQQALSASLEQDHLDYLLNFPLIKAHPVLTKAGKQKQLNFPNTSLGYIYTLDKDGRTRPIVAQEVQYVPLQASLGFIAALPPSSIVFRHPEVLSRLGDSEFMELIIQNKIREKKELNTPSYLEKYQTFSLKLLDIASSWKNLVSLQIFDLPLDKAAVVDVFNKYKHITQLALNSCSNFDGELISNSELFKHLTSLELLDCGKVDGILSKLAPDSKISRLFLSARDITPDTASILARFPALERLTVLGPEPMTREQINQLLVQLPKILLRLRKDTYKSQPDIIEVFKGNPRVRFK